MPGQVGPNTNSGGAVTGGLQHQDTITLNNAQFKSLPGTRRLLANAPGSNRIIVPCLTVLAITGFSAHPYTGADADGYLSLVAEDGSDIQDITVNDSGIPLTGLTDLLSSQDGFMPISVPYTQGFFQGWGIIQTSVYPNTSYRNTAVYIGINNNGSTTDLGGGDAGNSMVVAFAYYILNTVTGEFE